MPPGSFADSNLHSLHPFHVHFFDFMDVSWILGEQEFMESPPGVETGEMGFTSLRVTYDKGLHLFMDS